MTRLRQHTCNSITYSILFILFFAASGSADPKKFQAISNYFLSLDFGDKVKIGNVFYTAERRFPPFYSSRIPKIGASDTKHLYRPIIVVEAPGRCDIFGVFSSIEERKSDIQQMPDGSHNRNDLYFTPQAYEYALRARSDCRKHLEMLGRSDVWSVERFAYAGQMKRHASNCTDKIPNILSKKIRRCNYFEVDYVVFTHVVTSLAGEALSFGFNVAMDDAPFSINDLLDISVDGPSPFELD